ncbi:MAG: homocysteine S-methyltransferase family protein [Flavonifractor plautii]
MGFNCVSGPRHLLKYIQTLELSDKPLTVMPNAGYPTVLGRRTVFGGQPDYFAGQIAQIVQAGASIVGGLLRYYAGTYCPDGAGFERAAS